MTTEASEEITAMIPVLDGPQDSDVLCGECTSLASCCRALAIIAFAYLLLSFIYAPSFFDVIQGKLQPAGTLVISSSEN
jgi:hypothetical protein